MAWYTAQATITMEVEAESSEEAASLFKALLEKRVCQQEWGSTAKVRETYEVNSPELDDPDPYACKHCGLPGGH